MGSLAPGYEFESKGEEKVRYGFLPVLYLPIRVRKFLKEIRRLHLDIWLTSTSGSAEMANQIAAFKEALGATDRNGKNDDERLFKELRIRYVRYDQFGIPFVVSRCEKAVDSGSGGVGGMLSELSDLEWELGEARVEDEAVCKGMMLGARV